MDTQQLLIILMVVLFVVGLVCGHAIGYARRRDQIRYLQAKVRVQALMLEQDGRQASVRGSR